MNPEHNRSCPHCGAVVTPETRYCLSCGRALVAEAPTGSLFQRFKQDSVTSLLQRKKDLGFSPPTPSTGTVPRGPTALTFPSCPSMISPLRDIMAADLQVHLDSLPFVSYALQHAGIGSINRLRIHNGSTQPSQNLLIEMGLAPGDLGENWTCNIPLLGPGQDWEQTNIHLPLYRDRLRTVVEKEQAFLKVRISDRRETLWTRTLEVQVLAYNEWLFVPEFMQLLAAFVQPNAPALEPVVQRAAARLHRATGTAAFSGYQAGGPQRVLEMIQAVHETLAQDLGIGYINPPPSFEASGQKIRLVADTLHQKRGTCLDLAVLQSALWEHVGLHPLIFVMPNHAFLGCWMEERQSSAPVVELTQSTPGADEVVKAITDAVLLPFNSTEIAGGASLQTAAAQGAALVAQALQQPDSFLFVIDLVTSHRLITPLP